MTFDWFQRRYDKDQAEQTPSADKEPAKSEPEAQEPATTETSEDYLNWAKVAYENIRKRQQAEQAAAAAEAAPAPVQTLPEQTLVEPEADTAPDVAADLAPADLAPGESAAATQDLTTEPSAPESAPEPDSTPEPEAEPTAPPVAPLPFWAAAEAERQARLEQLRETAIAEPEPATSIVPATAPPSPPTAIPDFLLDEGFVWSAEVLAAQGRRPDEISIEEITWLKRLRQGLGKTRRGLVNQLRAIVGQGPLTQDAILEIESVLLQADVGVEATDAIIEALQKKLRSEVLPPDAAITYLKQILQDMLDTPLGKYGNATFAPQKDTLNIWLMTGVNGAGKTTTIGKLAHIAQKSGYKCLIGAADTFRAAAVEQVKVWGARSGVEVIANPGKNTDPAAVVFDAITAAQARGVDLLLIDTAGRLQNKKNLMDELSKVRRIIDKKAPDAIVESLLVLDSTLGQNGLKQAEVFSEAAKLSGVVLTKLDGTAKGGIALAVVQQLGLPIRFIGAGEGIEDLRPFSSYEFIEALLNG